ncbi:hypothetical protein L6452_04946 [Arctium lappa]|uniref:Uncharacterized protein n=1 Tax=Arctium lappa TaxID=4217 RepID=A0ACB9EEN4_ARCLA|nr:hypothetical protein L6452_04946 [Arctium lappa]
MAGSGSALAQAYLLTKLHDEKTTSDANRTAKPDNARRHASSTIGCFPTFFNKTHPATSSIVPVSDHSSTCPSQSVEDPKPDHTIGGID